MELYEVGGCVRDSILGVPSKDIDFSCVLEPADIEAMTAHNQFDAFEYMVLMLNGLGFKIFLETPEHLTVRAQFPVGTGDFAITNLAGGPAKPGRKRLTADFVLARKEGTYTDGRRPDSVEPGTLLDDLGRRDLTVNAIAKAADGTLIDPFNGQQDIADGILRAVGLPFVRLTEDALRAVRALRFSVTLGFVTDPDLAFAMQTEAVLDSIVNKISDERISDELSRMFRFDTVASLRALQRFPLLTEAMFAGKVSLDSTLKQKGRGK